MHWWPARLNGVTFGLTYSHVFLLKFEDYLTEMRRGNGGDHTW